MAAGFDGAVWMCSSNQNGPAVARIDMAGDFTFQNVPGCASMTRNPNGNLYFASVAFENAQIGQISPEGIISYNTWRNPEIGPGPYYSVSGSDGNLYLLQTSGGEEIAQVSTSGVQTATYGPYDYIDSIATGPDGNLWFYVGCVNCQSFIGKLSLESNSLTKYPVDVPVDGLTDASDGGIWFDEGPAMGRLDIATGTLTSYPIKDNFQAVQIIQVAPTLLLVMGQATSVYLFDLASHVITKTYGVPGTKWDGTSGMILGPDFNAWMLSGGNHTGGFNGLDVLLLRQITTTPTSLNVPLNGIAPLKAAETHYLNGSFAATSTDTTVAQVIVDSKHGWTIEGVGPGSCDITVADIHGNSVKVPVTVTGSLLP